MNVQEQISLNKPYRPNDHLLDIPVQLLVVGRYIEISLTSTPLKYDIHIDMN